MNLCRPYCFIRNAGEVASPSTTSTVYRNILFAMHSDVGDNCEKGLRRLPAVYFDFDKILFV